MCIRDSGVPPSVLRCTAARTAYRISTVAYIVLVLYQHRIMYCITTVAYTVLYAGAYTVSAPYHVLYQRRVAYVIQ
eukprot:293912-Rhodomonas_salina.1